MMLTELQKIPGVGPNIEEHLLNLGYAHLTPLKERTLKRCTKGTVT